MDSVTSVRAAAEHHLGRTKKIRITKPVPQQVEYSMSVPVLLSAASKLCEDELSLICRNVCLSTTDLLTLRLVNKSWRDAASSTLLRRDACYIALDNKVNNCITSYFRQHGDKKGTLIELTDLMSRSQKFPASTLHVHAHGAWSGIDYSDYPDLLMFFRLHGGKIKTLFPHAVISLEPLLGILSTYTPNIECLDLSNASLLLSTPREMTTEAASKWTSKLIPIKSLIINDSDQYDHRQTLHLLLSSLPKLSRIENVNMTALSSILNESKGHFIRNFKCTISRFSSVADVSQLQEFAGVNPQLTSLTLNVNSSRIASSTSISSILDSSKDTLQQLELSMCPFDYQTKLRVFPMKKLRSISLSGQYSLDSSEGRVDTYSIFEDGMSASTCFPSLFQLRLRNLNVEKDLMRLFQFTCNIDGTGTLRNCLPQVKVLVCWSCLPKNSDSTLISRFLPNLRVFKVNCNNFNNFKNSFWTLFPSVEFLEIYDISISKDALKDGVIFFTDMFFTGFSSRLCEKLRETTLPESYNNAQGLKDLRGAPSICDLKHLKELTLKFSELWSAFASRVTGIYAFSKMGNTKCIVSYDPVAFSRKRAWNIAQNIDHAELCFGAIKPYVQIVHEKQTTNGF